MTTSDDTHVVTLLQDGAQVQLPAKLNTGTAVASGKDVDREADRKLAIDNIKGVIELSAKPLEELAELAVQSQSARAFEVFSTLMRSVVDANKTLIDIHDRKEGHAGREPRSVQQGDDGRTLNQTIVFSGSPKDMAKAMKEYRELNGEVPDDGGGS